MKALNHSEARLLIEQAADGLLSASEQRALETHLKGCADCRTYAAEFAALESALGGAMLERWGKPKLSPSAEMNMVHEIVTYFGYNSLGEAQKETVYDHETGSPSSAGALRRLLIGMGVGLIVLILLAVTLFGPALGIFGPSHTPTFTETVTSSAISTASSTPTATTTPTITETPSPAVLILIAIPQQNVNCREGNGSAFEIADTLMEGEEYSPTGRGYDNMWVRFVGPTFQQVCWAAIGNLVLEINEVLTAIEDIPESLLPFVNYPATPTPSPTITFTPEGDEPFTPQCNDGIDNDSDRAIDFPRDKNCTSANDNDESK